MKPMPRALKLLKQLDVPDRQVEHEAVNGIPLLGKVAAGLPTDSVENYDRISLSDCFGNTDEVFALQVSGESMIEEDIRDGDYVICKRSDTARNGQLVVALTENENTTLKRFYREDSRVRLEPANKDFDPIYSEDCEVQAIAIGLVRKL